MKRFEYSLQAILTLRERAEQKALEKYAAALKRRALAEATVNGLKAAQAESWHAWREQIAHPWNATALVQWYGIDGELTNRRKAAEASLVQVNDVVQKALEEVLLARQNRESVTKHCERQRSEHVRGLGREEQKALDEIALRRTLSGRSALPAEEVLI